MTRRIPMLLSGFCAFPGHLDTGHEHCKNTHEGCPCPCHEKEEK